MPSIVLRVARADFDVTSFLAEFPVFEPDAVWHQGEVFVSKSGYRRGPRTTSGFNHCLADVDDRETALQELRAELAELEVALRTLLERRVPAEIDVGIFVGPNLPKSITFTNEDLHRFAVLGLDLQYSAYPCSDAD